LNLEPIQTLHVLYFLSGFVGLLYEIVWLRLLSLELGHTAGAIATVLAAFMGGLAAGAGLAGRWLARHPSLDLARDDPELVEGPQTLQDAAHQASPTRALHLYAALEILIACCALALPFALDALRPFLAIAYGDAGGTAFAALRVVLCLVLVGVPAAAMGATYPIAIRASASLSRRQARPVEGTLYAVNTAGAALGAALTGFLLLPAAGMWRTTLTGVVLNALVAAGAIWMARRTGETQPSPGAVSGRRSAERTERSVGQLRLAAVVLFFTGFIALTSEVAWTKVFALAIGPTTYAFTVMLVAFIAGLAAGAAVGNRLAARAVRPAAYLTGCLAVIAIGTAIDVAWIERVPLMVGEWVAAGDAWFGSVLAAEALLCAILLLPVTMALGAAFPLALAYGIGPPSLGFGGARRSAARIQMRGGGGRDASAPTISRKRDKKTASTSTARGVERDAAGPAGWLFAGNTAGAIAGSLAAGFALIPWAGVRATLLLSAGLALLAGAGVAWSTASGPRGRLASGALLGGIAGLWIVPPWNPSLLTGGAYKYAPYMRRLELREALEAGTLLYYREGSASTVSVRRTAGQLSLAIDGKVDASNGGDMLTQKLLAHLPLLAHPAPRQVAIVGLGSGVTAGAALRHPVERVDVVEISPEVVDASRLFDADSGRPLADPRTRLLVGDARTHFALSSNRYDIIISEPSNPWMAGVAALFTREFFERARGRLAPGGVVCQWAHTYDIRDEDLRSIVATFSEVFPATSLWLIGDADLLILGSEAPSADHAFAVSQAFGRAGVAPDLATVGVTSPFGLLSLFVGHGRAIADFVARAEIQRDDRLHLEFSGPRSIIGTTTTDNARTLRELLQRSTPPPSVTSARSSARPSDWTDRGFMLLRAGSTAAMDDFARAIEMGDARAMDGFRRAAIGSGRVEEALTILDRLSRTRQEGTFDVTISRLLAGSGDVRGATEAAERSVRRDRGNVEALTQLASVQADEGDAEGLGRTLVSLRALAPDAADTRYYDGVHSYLRGDLPSAVTLAGQALDRQPGHARALTLSGAAHASLGERDRARRAFEASVAATPDDPAPYVNLGELELRGGNAIRAYAWFTEALAIEPDSAAAREGLAASLELRGERARAARVRSRRFGSTPHRPR